VALTDTQRATYQVVLGLLKGGRGLLFGSADAALPPRTSKVIAGDDLIPQFGFVGRDYESRRILIIGINPGNGPDGSRTLSDDEMMPALHRFVAEPTEVTYEAASLAQAKAFPNWLASKEIGPILEAEGLTTNDVAYANASPYRAGNGEAKDAFPNQRRIRAAADAWLSPLLRALMPRVVLAHGQVAANVLVHCTFPTVPIVYNRNRNLRARSAANAEFVTRLRAAL